MGTTSAAQSVKLSNTGTASLSITGLSATAPFAQTNNCGSSVAAGGSCTISVTFTPTVSGSVSGTLSVSDNASGSPQTVSLSGSGATSSGGGSATDFYVSTTGSDSSGNGSSSSPWATIQHASTQIGPGATVHVAAGTYAGNITTTTSGTSSARITYVSDPPGAAKIVNSSYNGSLNQNVWDNEGSFVAIQGFDVSGDAYQGIGNGGSNVVIKGNHVHNIIPVDCNSNGGAGIDDHGNSGDDIGNVVSDVGNFALGPCGFVHGIYANRTGGHIWNNIIFHIWSNGIQLWGAPQGVTISGNTVSNSALDGLVLGSDTTAADNMVVTDNIFAHNGNYGFEEQGKTGSNNQYNNNLTYFNTLGYFKLQTGTQSATVEAPPVFANFQGDPVLNQPSDAALYFELQPTSPAINAGTSQGAPSYDFAGNARPQTRSSGNGWDIGAYEFMGTPSSTGSLSVSPTSLTFANQTVATTSSAQTVTLSNDTSSAVSLAIAISGTDASDFAETNNCGASVAASGSCTISVTFAPKTTGTLSATLTITPGSSSALSVSLSGMGVSSTGGSTVSISPDPLTFPSTTVGTNSAVETATLTNKGSSALTITALFTITGDFAFDPTSGSCPAVGASVPAGGSCTITVIFTPTATGTRTGTMTVLDSAGTQKLSLSGTGASSSSGSSVTISPDPLTFPSTTVGTMSAIETATLTNKGSSALTITALFTITGDFAFDPTAGSCPAVGASVPAGGSCTITVTFTPTSTGTRIGTVTVFDSAGAQTFSLTGMGVSSMSATGTTTGSKDGDGDDDDRAGSQTSVKQHKHHRGGAGASDTN